MDGPDGLWMGRGELVRDRPRRVTRAVVDDDDLERLGDRRQCLEGFVDEATQVRLLVVGREEIRQVSEALGHGQTAFAEARRYASAGGGAWLASITSVSSPVVVGRLLDQAVRTIAAVTIRGRFP